MDPLGNVPAFISIVHKKRVKLATKYLIICAIIIFSFAVLANLLFSLFNIAIFIFRLIAGILLFILGLKMLIFKNRSKKPLPYIISLYAGPGVITTTIYMLSKAKCIEEMLFVYLTVILAIIFSWLSIFYFEKYKSNRKIKKLIGYAVGWKGFLLIIFGIYFTIDAFFGLLSIL